MQSLQVQVPRGGLPSLNEMLAAHTPAAAYGIAFLGDVLWLVVYVIAIRIAIKQKTYAIPAAAIVLNVTWEFVHSVVFPPPAVTDLIATLLWLGFDLVILIQLLRHGERLLQAPTLRRLFRPAVWAAVGVAVAGNITFYVYVTNNAVFPDRGGVILAYIINLVMSLLFIAMLFARPDRQGISRGIAWAKMLGTGCTSLANTISILSLPEIVYDVQIRAAGATEWTPAGQIGSSTIHPAFLYFLFLAVLTVDVLYLVLIYRPRASPFEVSNLARA